jgi:hypothetical protein
VWCGVLALALPLQAYRLLTRRYSIAAHVLFVSVVSTLIAEWLLLGARDARYLLPLSALLVALATVEIVDLVDRQLLSWKTAAVVTSGMLLLGSLSMREFREFNYLWKNPSDHWAERKRLQQIFGYLKVKDVSHVFSMNGLLDTQLVFYSDEKVLARWTHPVGKYHPFVRAVNQALADGKPIAVVGYTHTSGAPGCLDVPICSGGLENLVPNPESMFIVDGKYFVYVGANRDVLKTLGFRFWD